MARIRVATYNVYLGADLTPLFGASSPGDLLGRAGAVLDQVASTRFAERAEAIAAVIVRERIGLLGLQEVASWEGDPAVRCDFAALLLGALERAGEAYDVHARNATFHGGIDLAGPGQGPVRVTGYNMTLVRRSGAVSVRAQQTGVFGPTLQIHTGGERVVLPVVRGWGVVTAFAGGRRFRFANTHTEAYDAGIRDAQRDELLGHLDDEDPVILVGDFNATPGSVGMPERFLDAWVAGGGGGPGHTCGQLPDLRNQDSLLDERIDYVWVAGARVLDCTRAGHRGHERSGVSGLWPSDHACVVAEIEL